MIDEVNQNDAIHGVLLFRPLPKHLDQNLIENALDPAKDVDCMTDGSMSRVFTGKAVGFPPVRLRHAWRFWITTELTVPERRP